MVDVAIVEGVIRRTGKVAFYNVDVKTIVLDHVFIQFWEVDSVKTEKILKWLVAHEFYHYLVECRRPINILKQLRGIEERRASFFAYRETGIKWGEVKEYFAHLKSIVKV
jgi:hypothetical protein